MKSMFDHPFYTIFSRTLASPQPKYVPWIGFIFPGRITILHQLLVRFSMLMDIIRFVFQSTRSHRWSWWRSGWLVCPFCCVWIPNLRKLYPRPKVVPRRTNPFQTCTARCRICPLENALLDAPCWVDTSSFVVSEDRICGIELASVAGFLDCWIRELD